MKINSKYYNKINTTPFLVQETKSGTIELYKLKDYPEIYNLTVSKGRFYFWSANGTDLYKLLLEEEYFEELKDLYSKRTNEVQIKFYKDIDVVKKSVMLKCFLPLTIAICILFVIITLFVGADSGFQMPLYLVVIIGFVGVNSYINRKMNLTLTQLNGVALDELKNILGASRFEELLDQQDAYIEEFYRKQRAELGIEEPDDFAEDSIDNIQEEVEDTPEEPNLFSLNEENDIVEENKENLGE